MTAATIKVVPLVKGENLALILSKFCNTMTRSDLVNVKIVKRNSLSGRESWPLSEELIKIEKIKFWCEATKSLNEKSYS